VVKIFDTPENVLSALADLIVDQASAAIKTRGVFNFVLSGGSSPKKLYELLTSEKYRQKIDWTKVYFFFGDERYVPADSKDSNFRMARESLFEPLKIATDHVFPMDTTLSPERSALRYAEQIQKHFDGKTSSFDLTLLGLGDNSHTASLFPHTEVLHEKSAWVSGLYIEEVSMSRITMTAPLINQSHVIVFLVYGEGKAEAVHHILKDPLNIEEYPAQLIKPLHGELYWFLDKGAAQRV
jgi:6-phosphogluconolactonase